MISAEASRSHRTPRAARRHLAELGPADREHLAGWLTRFDPAVTGPVAFAMEACTGWRYIAEEMAKAGVTAHRLAASRTRQSSTPATARPPP
jgi:hypothetical protein